MSHEKNSLWSKLLSQYFTLSTDQFSALFAFLIDFEPNYNLLKINVAYHVSLNNSSVRQELALSLCILSMGTNKYIKQKIENNLLNRKHFFLCIPSLHQRYCASINALHNHTIANNTIFLYLLTFHYARTLMWEKQRLSSTYLLFLFFRLSHFKNILSINYYNYSVTKKSFQNI